MHGHQVQFFDNQFYIRTTSTHQINQISLFYSKIRLILIFVTLDLLHRKKK